MKDFYDITTIAHTMNLDGDVLSQAIKATFERRRTKISTEPLYAFSDAFKQDQNKQSQWHAFLNKNVLKTEINFVGVIVELQCLLEPVYQAIAAQRPFQLQWFSDEFKWKEK